MPNYQRAIERAAKRYGVRPSLLIAQLTQESGLRPNAVSPAGARGIAQFMPGTAKGYGVNLYDNRASDDIYGAARHMRDLLDKYGGNEKYALAAYNAGAGAVDKYGGVPPYAETQNYVRTVLGAAKRERSSGERDRATYGAATPADGPDPDAKRALLASYLLNRDKPDALLELAAGLQQQPRAASQREANVRPEGESRSSGRLKELFYQGPGGLNVKNGRKVPQGFVSGHQSHVHVATGPKDAVRLGKLAQRMGLTVRENEAFDPVDPVHTQGSYHYSNRAIDVSGDPAVMRKFARRVAKLYGVK